MWRADGILCTFTLKLSELLRAAQNNSDLLHKLRSDRASINPIERNGQMTLSREDMRMSLKEIVKVFPTLDPQLDTEEGVATIRLKTKAERIKLVNNSENRSSASDNEITETPKIESEIMDVLKNASKMEISVSTTDEDNESGTDQMLENEYTNGKRSRSSSQSSHPQSENKEPRLDGKESGHKRKSSRNVEIMQVPVSESSDGTPDQPLAKHERRTIERKSLVIPEKLAPKMPKIAYPPELRDYLQEIKKDKSITNYFFILSEGHLRKYASHARDSVLDDIWLEPCQFEEVPGRPNSFEVRTEDDTLLLKAKSLEDMCTWIMVLIQHKFAAETASSELRKLQEEESRSQQPIIESKQEKSEKTKSWRVSFRFLETPGKKVEEETIQVEDSKGITQRKSSKTLIIERPKSKVSFEEPKKKFKKKCNSRYNLKFFTKIKGWLYY